MTYISDVEILDQLVPHFDLTDEELLRVFAHHGLLLPEEREAKKRSRPRITDFAADALFGQQQKAALFGLQQQQSGGLDVFGGILGGLGRGFGQ